MKRKRRRTKLTPLDQDQLLRLINVMEFEQPIRQAHFVAINGIIITKVNLKFDDHEESVYLTSEDYDFVKFGIPLRRDDR